jgi:Rieske Fe-S protein
MTFNDTETDDNVQTAQGGHASRRTVLRGAGVVGAAAVAASLAACGSDSGSTDTAGGDSAPTGGGTPAPTGTDGGGASTGSSGGGAGGLAKTADIPVGGGKIFADQKIVVTQPTSGQFKAFTAVCTHMGCTVGTVSNNTIMCPCHGSQFSAADGSVKQGPAASPLAEKKVTVSGDEITVS